MYNCINKLDIVAAAPKWYGKPDYPARQQPDRKRKDKNKEDKKKDKQKDKGES